MLFPFPVCFALYSYKNCRWTLCLTGVLISGVLVLVEVLSQSRNSILGMAITFLVAFLLCYPRRWYLLTFVPIVIAIMIWIILHDVRLYSYWVMMRGEVAISFQQRVTIWARAIYMVQDFPFTGIGMGNFERLADSLYPFSIDPGGIHHAHNLFLQIAVDLGIPGLITWLAAWLGIIHISWRIYRGSHPFKALGAALFISQIVLGSVGLLDSVVWGGTKTAPLVWIVWGVAVAAWRITSQTELKSTPFLEMAGSSEPVDQMPGEEVVPNAITLEGGN